MLIFVSLLVLCFDLEFMDFSQELVSCSNVFNGVPADGSHVSLFWAIHWVAWCSVCCVGCIPVLLIGASAL